ncbi:hypothetical protein [Sphingobium algorifonticola]|nr:hypothetical protein [Sphingobium algorifonticola]
MSFPSPLRDRQTIDERIMIRRQARDIRRQRAEAWAQLAAHFRSHQS